MAIRPGVEEPSRIEVRDQLQTVVTRLIDDYSQDLAAGSVIRCVARCTDAVARAQVPRVEMSDAVERLARTLLDARVCTGSWISLSSAWRDVDDAPVPSAVHSHSGMS
jgi:hypothetical protein